MANLNIPFLLLQPSTCKFEPDISTSKIISYDKYTVPRAQAPFGIPVRESFHAAGAGVQNISNMHNMQSRQSEYSHRNQMIEENSGSTKFEFAKYSTFEDTPRNLIVTSDESGNIVLWHQDSFTSKSPLSDQAKNHNRISKFIMSVVPRVVLTPSISKQIGLLVTYCLIKSPAPNILSTSVSLLVTLHNDGILRLWTTDDGRCVVQSQAEQLIPRNVTPARCTIQTLNSGIGSMSGIIVLASPETKEIFFINAYKMILLKKMALVCDGSMQGTIGIKSFDRTLMIIDRQRGVIQWFQRDGEASTNMPMSGGSNQMRNLAQQSQASSSSSYTPQQQTLIDITNIEDSILTSMLNYKLKQTIGHQDYGQILTFKQFPRDMFLLAKSKAVLTFVNNDSHAILLPERSQQNFIFAKCINVSHQTFLLLIDSELNLFVFDPLKQKQLYKENLMKITSIIGASNHSGKKESITLFNGSSLLVDKEEKNDEKLAIIQQFLLQKVQQGGKIFRVNSQERFLYTIAKIQGAQTLITWNLSTLLSNIFAGLTQNHPLIPLNLQPLNIFQSQSPHDNSFVLNLQPILIRYIYNRHQFSFLYSDEQVTASAIYVSAQHPCYLVGTSYGRIFMLSMFEDSSSCGDDEELHQDRISPIILIDSHNSSPITKLFVAYKSARRANQEQGGHLVSVSENGTIAVTNLNSGEIHKQIHQYTAQSKEKWNGKRADSFFNERSKNMEVKRRNSFSNDFSVANFYHMVKVKSQMVYSYAVGFGQVDKIIEVKNINAMQEQLQQKMKLTSEPSGQFKKPNQEEGYYGCVSSQGGTIHLLKIVNMRVELFQLSGLDTESEVLGIYADTNLNLLNVLTQKSKDSRILLYIYNSKSNSLLRRVDHKHAMDILMVKDTLEQIITRNEGLKGKGASFFDFDGFQSFFKNTANQQHLMGLGSHKLLDYMSLALNLPLEYHPHTAFSAKYTKTMHDLLEVKGHINNVLGLTKPQNPEEVNDSQRVIIRALNEAVYLNNKIYQSDFDEELYTKTSGATCITTADNTFLGSKQHILIANCKQMLSLHQQRIQQHKMRSSPPVPFKANLSSSPDASPEDPKFIMKFGSSVEEEKSRFRPSPLAKQLSSSDSEPLAQNKWPTKLLSLLHPFNIEANLDDALEKFMGLNIPFLDFRVGLQGAHESFSFVVTREDEDFHYDRQNPIKLMRLLRLAQHKKKMMDQVTKEFNVPPQIRVETFAKSNNSLKNELMQIESEMDALLQNEPIVRFYGSEHWKISSYLSTLLPTFFLSILTGICEYAKDDVTQIMQDWLTILQKINQQRTISDTCRLSLSAASKILLKKDVSISVTSRDLLIKPVLLTLAGTDRMNDVIEEFTAIILDTYKKLKKESTLRSVYGNSTNQSQASVSTSQTNSSSQIVQQPAPQQQTKLINSFFGELELRGLICLSYYALYNNDQLDVNLRYRVSKLTTILTREVVEKFNSDRRYIHLLTHLLQLLSVWMKSQNNQLNNKAMIGEVIRLLLLIYNMNKQQLNRDNVMTRVTGDNFYLIKPTHPELFLKLTAAKALLVISESYTHDFLVMIQEEASHLNQGGEYQQNVLDILKIFINSSTQTTQQESGSTVNLEHHLIQITAILLKCFDPNEPALRKNSHKIVSVILNMLVKMFPMVDFHHESQRLAVGTHEGPIAIYDMRTAMKWKILEGHQGNITCLAFDSKGNMLASYSAVDRTLQLWKVSSTGFFSTIIGGTSKSSNKVVLPALKVKNPHARRNLGNDANFVAMQDNNRTDNLMQEEPNQSTAVQSSSNKRVNCCYIKFIGPKDKEVDIKREDGNVEKIKIVK